jgi:hypothetical protein
MYNPVYKVQICYGITQQFMLVCSDAPVPNYSKMRSGKPCDDYAVQWTVVTW